MKRVCCCCLFIILLLILVLKFNINYFNSVKQTIAVVGNGSLTSKDYSRINKFDIVYRFNDCKNYRNNDKITHLVVRQTNLTNEVTGLNSNYETDKNVNNIIFIGTSKSIFLKIKKNNEKKNVRMIDVWEELLHKKESERKPNYDIIKFNNNFIKPPYLPSGPSSGFLLISNIYNDKIKMEIFGMNFNFETTAHNGIWETKIIEENCKNCILNKTKNENYLPT